VESPSLHWGGAVVKRKKLIKDTGEGLWWNSSIRYSVLIQMKELSREAYSTC